MPAPSKRRRVSLYSLPVVVATGLLVVAQLAAWQQSDIVADLADCVARGETREATEAVHKLAVMPNPPIPVLVEAAAADEHATAEAGQLAISRLLRRWQRDMETGRRVSAIANQLCELAKALAENQNDFAAADYPWLASTTGKILKLANKLPAKKTPLVAIHCDAILAAVKANRSLTSKESTPGIAEFSTPSTETANEQPVKDTHLPGTLDSEKAMLEREFSTFDLPAATFGGSTSEQTENGRPPVSDGALPRQSAGVPDSESELDDGTVGANHRNSQVPSTQGGSVGDDGHESDQLSLKSNPLRDMAWSQPLLRTSPVMQADVAPVDRGMPVLSAPDRSSTTLRVEGDNPWARASSRELLQRWLAKENSDVQSIEQELAKRGFGKITPNEVRQYLSEDAKQRMHVIDKVLARPGGGGGAWLRLLADDPNADVRLFAVTLMATSNDAALVEKAWQAAIHDRDPRVADLAERLRERRAGTLRR